MNLYNKEAYITARQNPNEWKNHVNVKTLENYHQYIYGDVLDIGSNHGATTYWLKDFNVKSITALDLNKESLDIAELNLKDLDITKNFITQNYAESNIGIEFDTIISFHTLEHIYPSDTVNFVKNIYSDIKSGGHVIIGIPYDRHYPDPCHVSFYTEATLMDLFESNGFKTIECFKEDRYQERNILTGLFKK